MDASLPRLARHLGLAGLIPFLAGGVGVALGFSSLAFPLAAYGATILAFLGAVHWGLALRAPAAEVGATWPRLGLGVVPQLVGWVALLLPIGAGLALVAAGLLVTAAMETLAARRGLLPWDYLRLRWLLSCGAAGCLMIAVVVR